MKDDLPSFLPRPGDLPRKELILLADKTILEGGGPERCQVYFKFTCIWCGTRCTLVEPNTLYEEGECLMCGRDTPITVGGMVVHYKMKR